MAGQAPHVPPTAAGHTEDERLKGAVAYILGFITGIIVLLIAENNRFLKFHAMQSIVSSIVICVVFMILNFILAFTIIIPCLLFIVEILIWLYFLYGAYQVYQGKDFRMPFFADFVEQNLMK
jgi:uncharacterized membrane protein